MRGSWALLFVACGLLSTATALAFDSLASRLPRNAPLSAILGSGEARAEVKDGPLLGIGHERVTLLDDGRLRVERTRTYTRLRHPETGRLVKLPEPWRMHSRLTVSSGLRLRRAETRLEFHKSADDVLGDYKLSEERASLFERDRIKVVANAAATKLTRTSSLRGEVVERDSYDYPQDAIPIEVIGLSLSAAVDRRIDRFDFDLLLPGGSTHGVRSVVHRTQDASAFADGYGVPKRRLPRGEDLAVIEMRLSSPVKYMFFPHKFYIVYAASEPRRQLALWGGDPDEHLQAFRLE
jgi:hypothetical protein